VRYIVIYTWQEMCQTYIESTKGSSVQIQLGEWVLVRRSFSYFLMVQAV